MPATFTLTGDLLPLVGSPKRRSVYVQSDRSISDPTNDVNYETASVTQVAGKFELTDLPAFDALNLPHGATPHNLLVTIGTRKWLVPAQAAGTTHDLSSFPETTAFTPVTQNLLLAAQAAASAAAASADQAAAFAGGVGENVRAYGATGDGSSDDRAAIQAAIDAAGPGGATILPAGRYVSGGTLYLPDKATLHGAGPRSTTLVLKAGANCTLLQTRDDGVQRYGVGVYHVGFDGNGANQTDASDPLLWFPGCNEPTLEDVYVLGSRGDSIKFGQDTAGMYCTVPRLSNVVTRGDNAGDPAHSFGNGIVLGEGSSDAILSVVDVGFYPQGAGVLFSGHNGATMNQVNSWQNKFGFQTYESHRLRATACLSDYAKQHGWALQNSDDLQLSGCQARESSMETPNTYDGFFIEGDSSSDTVTDVQLSGGSRAMGSQQRYGVNLNRYISGAYVSGNWQGNQSGGVRVGTTGVTGATVDSGNTDQAFATFATTTGTQTKQTLDAAYQTLATPAYAAPRTRPYDQQRNVYRASAAEHRKIRAVLGHALAGTTLVPIMCMGDSITAGFKGVPGISDPVTIMRNLFKAAGYPVTGGWVFPANGNTSSVDARWTLTTSQWAGAGTANNGYRWSGTTNATALFTSDLPGTVAEFICFSTTSAPIAYSIDGGAEVAYTITPGTLNKVQVTGLANTTHTIQIRRSGSSSVWIGPARVRATTGLSISNAGIYASWAADWNPQRDAATTPPGGAGGPGVYYNPFNLATGIETPKLIMVGLGANEALNGGTRDNMTASLTTVVQAAKAIAPTVMKVNSPLGDSVVGAGNVWTDWVKRMYDVADTTGTMLIDHTDAMGTNVEGVANGLLSDAYHPVAAGYAAIGRRDKAALESA